jgi:hypothetical protein
LILSFVRPWPEAILDIQRAEGSYYFSAAFGAVLRKYGYIGEKTVHGVAAGGYGFVCRNTPWSDEWAHSALVLEGPLHNTVTETLGIKAQSLVQPEFKVRELGNGGIWALRYSTFRVRRIPERGNEQSLPFRFHCSDPLWNKNAFSVQHFLCGADWQPVLEVHDDSEGRWYPMAVRRRNLLLLGAPLLDIAAFEHTFPPLCDAGYYNMEHASQASGICNWLFGVAQKLFLDNDQELVRCLPWPDGHTAALSIRHDYDRKITDDQHARILRFYASSAVKSTWFWLNRNYQRAQIKSTIQDGHEVALHSEAKSDDQFRAEVDDFIARAGLRPQGVTAHGGAGAIGYLGHASMVRTRSLGCLYGEILGRGYDWPHGMIGVVNGYPESFDLVIPPPHLSLDLSTKPEGHNLVALCERVPATLAKGAYCIVMNHPDIHVAELEALITSLDLRSVWKATLAEVARWTRVLAITSEVRGGTSGFMLMLREPLPKTARLEVVRASGRRTVLVEKGSRAFDLSGHA